MNGSQYLSAIKSSLRLTLILCLLALVACTSKPGAPLERTAFVDTEKFAGQWYVIANIPYFAERNKVGSRSIYTKRKDKLFEDVFIARNKNFDNKEKRLVGKVRSLNAENNQWRSTFYGVLNFTFDVLYVDEAYQIVLFGHPSRNYGWVMARSSEIETAQYKAAMDVFARNKYDTSRFSKVPQHAEQLGQTGFQGSGE